MDLLNCSFWQDIILSLFVISPAEGERLNSGELEEFIRQVISSGTLQEVGSEASSSQPKELLRTAMSLSATAVDKFLQDLSEGRYDSPQPKIKVRVRGGKLTLGSCEG